MSTTMSSTSHNVNINGKQNTDNKQNTIGDYIIGAKLGEGTFSKVCQGTHITTNEKVAIKILSKSQIKEPNDKIRIEKEINIQKRLHHNSIIQQYCVIETKAMIYIITEYCSGGELFDYIVSKRKLYENEACRIFQQLICGWEYLHKQRIVHRDWKPENLWFDSKHDLKIADFGLSNDYTGKWNTPCGSPCYAAPEMVTGNKYNGSQVDIWSSGIVLYTMVCGYLPFEDDDQNVLFRKIAKGIFKLPNSLSTSCKDLLKKILNTDPAKRITFEQIKHHPWFVSVNNNMKGESIFFNSPGIFIKNDIIPIDEDIVYELKTKFDFKWRNIINDVIKNKHNNLTTTYYLILKRKIRNGEKSVSDISSRSEAFLNYLKTNISKLSYWNNDLERIILYYENLVDKRFNGNNPANASGQEWEIENGYGRVCVNNTNNDNGSNNNEFFNTMTHWTFPEENTWAGPKKNGAENGNVGHVRTREPCYISLKKDDENKKNFIDTLIINHTRAPVVLSTVPNINQNNSKKIDELINKSMRNTVQEENNSESDNDFDDEPAKAEFEPSNKDIEQITTDIHWCENNKRYQNKSVDNAEIKTKLHLNTITNVNNDKLINDDKDNITKPGYVPVLNIVTWSNSNNEKNKTIYCNPYTKNCKDGKSTQPETGQITYQKHIMPNSCNQIKKFINKLSPNNLNKDILNTEINNSIPKANGLVVSSFNPVLSTEPSPYWNNNNKNQNQNKMQGQGQNNNMYFGWRGYNKLKEKKRPLSIDNNKMNPNAQIKTQTIEIITNLSRYQNNRLNSVGNTVNDKDNNYKNMNCKQPIRTRAKHFSQEITGRTPFVGKPNETIKFPYLTTWENTNPNNNHKFKKISVLINKPSTTKKKKEVVLNTKFKQFNRNNFWISNHEKMKHYSQEPSDYKPISNVFELTCPKNNGNSFIVETDSNINTIKAFHLNSGERNNVSPQSNKTNRNYHHFKTKTNNYNYRNNMNIKLKKFINKEKKKVLLSDTTNNENSENNNSSIINNTKSNSIPKNSYKQTILWKEREIINNQNMQYLNICCKKTVDNIKTIVSGIIGHQMNWVKNPHTAKIQYECRFTDKWKNYTFLLNISKLEEVKDYFVITPTWLKGNMGEFKNIFDRIKRKLI